MKNNLTVLFTGSSSFTGYWFIKQLVEEGFRVIATVTKKRLDAYKEVRYIRVKELLNFVEVVWDIKFGCDNFLKLIESRKIDVFCNHASYIENYKSMDFNIIEALDSNTKNINRVFEVFAKNGCKNIIYTGSFFEPYEGYGEKPIRAFSLYGLSKNFSSEIFKFYTSKFNLKLGKFVIPNVFGPFEEPRFTTYLIKHWKEKKVPIVQTPKYIRDNIHVSLLAKVYVYFIKKLYNSPELFLKINPSGYIESQGDFALRFAHEMGIRLNINTPLKFIEQSEFNEPRIRINYDIAELIISDWNEVKAWDELAQFYKNFYL